MSGYMTVSRILRPDCRVYVNPVDRHPDDYVIKIDEIGAYLSIHISADTAHVADRIAAAFTEAAASARAAKAANSEVPA